MRLTIDGLAYAVERGGSGSPLVVLHGFTGSIDAMRATIDALRERHDVIAIDLPGHGATASPAGVERYRMARVARDLAQILGRLDVERAAWLGYSLGARVALHVAVHEPSVVRALILEGASPGIAAADERARRVADDELLAAAIERDGIAAFVDRWERIPLFATQARLPAAVRARVRAQRLRNDPHGLAASLRGMGQGAQAPLHERLAVVDVPVLLLAGAEDEKFVRIAGEMAAALPQARVERIADAGHAAHLERPDAFLAAVEAFLSPTTSI